MSEKSTLEHVNSDIDDGRKHLNSAQSDNHRLTPNLLIRFFSNPLVGILGSIASILSVLLAIFFYVGSLKSRELTYFVHPAKAIVARVGQTSRLSMLLDDKPLESDVTAVQLAFWNAGELPIKPENVLEPLTISIESNTPMIDAIIRRKSRDVVDIILNEGRLNTGHLQITWNILEKNDGATIQIIFAGGSNASINATAIIEGQKKLRLLQFSKKISSPSEQYELLVGRDKREAISFFFMAGTTLLLTFLEMVKRKRRNENIFNTLIIYLTIFSLVLLLFGFYYLVTAQQTGPPFGF